MSDIDVEFEKIFGPGCWVVDTSYRIDLNAVKPCVPIPCSTEGAPAAEATEASCTCHIP